MARNLTMGDGIVEPIAVAEVTASMFEMARVAPIRGRTLTDADADPAAPPVIVIGERLWRERFDADPGLLGRTVVVSGVPMAVVGVMPASFRFPSIHEVWQPLRIDESAVEPRAGIGISIWARLAPGVTPAEANAELAVLSSRAASDWPATHAHLRADVQPPAVPEVEDPEERGLLALANLVIALLVLVVSGNVALLMFARAATRETEILVRSALGASRRRLVAQFLAESSVLCGIAAILGLMLGQRAMAWGVTSFILAANDGEPLPFWITPALPPISIAFGIGLALMATIVTGVLPALKITRGLASRLRESTAGGGGLRIGGVWTVLIVAQIAVTVTLPAIAFFASRAAWAVEDQQIGVPPERYLTARLSRESGMSEARFEMAVSRVREDLAGAPGVGSVGLADRLPFMWNGFNAIEMDDDGQAKGGAESVPQHFISTAAAAPDFFATFEVTSDAGRLLHAGDFAGPPHVAVVNQSFVDKVLGGRSAIGRRFRYLRSSSGGQPPPQQQWIEIVGVVRDLAMDTEPSPRTAGVYLPLNLRAVDSVMLAARVEGDIAAATHALRSIVSKADPTLRVSDARPLSAVTADNLRTITYVVRAIGGVSLAALILALSGLYAVMSFTVSRRTREIGIRVALGSPRPHVLLAILRRPLAQITAGILAGGVMTFAITSLSEGTLSFPPGWIAYAIVMLGVCLLACVAPARRALRVDPITALRTE
jgi:predicted permease